MCHCEETIRTLIDQYRLALEDASPRERLQAVAAIHALRLALKHLAAPAVPAPPQQEHAGACAA